MIARRGFLAGILAAGVAPMFIKSGILMPSKALVDSTGRLLFRDKPTLITAEPGKAYFVHDVDEVVTITVPKNDMHPMGSMFTVFQADGAATQYMKVAPSQWLLIGPDARIVCEPQERQRPRLRGL